MGEIGVIYLLHFDEPFGKPDRRRAQRGRAPRKQTYKGNEACHYSGWASDLEARLAHHASGTGAVLPGHVAAKAAVEGREPWVVARLWAGDRNMERRIKNQGSAKRLCPVCCGREVYLPEIDRVSLALMKEIGFRTPRAVAATTRRRKAA